MIGPAAADAGADAAADAGADAATDAAADGAAADAATDGAVVAPELEHAASAMAAAPTRAAIRPADVWFKAVPPLLR